MYAIIYIHIINVNNSRRLCKFIFPRLTCIPARGYTIQNNASVRMRGNSGNHPVPESGSPSARAVPYPACLPPAERTVLGALSPYKKQIGWNHEGLSSLSGRMVFYFFKGKDFYHAN